MDLQIVVRIFWLYYFAFSSFHYNAVVRQSLCSNRFSIFFQRREKETRPKQAYSLITSEWYKLNFQFCFVACTLGM